MTMHSPEILLKELNHALRCLRGACTNLGDEDIDRQLLTVMQRLLLAEVLGNTWMVAVGGSQGAGKTTLMTSLYDMHGDGPQWLKGNEGRGEKLPVLITEAADCHQPQGYVRRLVRDAAGQGFEVKPVKVDIAEFQRAICDPQAEDLLPELRMPRRYFQRNNQAWLLLPGYEKQDRANRAWQQLMRQAMVAAGGCIIVTDETRMANQQQLEIVQDMLANELRNCQPIIVISKTEAHRHNPQRLADLCASAQATFQVPPELAEQQIIFSGADDPEYTKEWIQQLRSTIDETLNFSGQSNRHLQMSHLSALLGQDVTQVLNAIRSKSRLYFNRQANNDVDGQQVLEEILDTFDEAAEVLRADHKKELRELAGTALGNAQKVLNGQLIDNHEGFKNWLSTAFDTTSETSIKMQDLVQQAWRQGTPTFFADYARSLSNLTLGRLGACSENTDVHHQLSQVQAQPLMQLGYADKSSGQPLRFSAITPEAASNIRILLGNSSQAEELAHRDANKQFQGSVQLIPTLSLEYTRLLYAMPQVVGYNADLSPMDASSDRNVVAEGVENLQASVQLGKTAIRSLASVMAVDVLSDGDSAILGAIFGNMPAADTATASTVPAAAMPLTLHPVAIAATAVVVSSYLTAVAVTRLRNTEKKTSTQAHSMLLNVHDEHIAHLQRQFDDTMRVARARIKEKIRARYRMDETLMHKDRLAKAIADVKAITSDLRHELDAGATGLQLFIAERDC